MHSAGLGSADVIQNITWHSNHENQLGSGDCEARSKSFSLCFLKEFIVVFEGCSDHCPGVEARPFSLSASNIQKKYPHTNKAAKRLFRWQKVHLLPMLKVIVKRINLRFAICQLPLELRLMHLNSTQFKLFFSGFGKAQQFLTDCRTFTSSVF